MKWGEVEDCRKERERERERDGGDMEVSDGDAKDVIGDQTFWTRSLLDSACAYLTMSSIFSSTSNEQC
jgi:hypothetical protein